jgi:heptosyltransferase I
MPRRILVVRLGAMGDILHTLPAVATLRRSFRQARITWLVEPRWRPLLESNPAVDEIAEFDRAGGISGMWRSSFALRMGEFDLGIDFQGLIKSAAALRVAGPNARWGRRDPREAAARFFYTNLAELSESGHIVEQHLELARAAGAGERTVEFPLPPGQHEGVLPEGRFVLASPLAGWTSKQWPMENYGELAALLLGELSLPLVLNLPPGAETSAAGQLPARHVSGLPGLIEATRRATAVVGVDSGPLHLAAALAKPGVAIFGPTDPVRNGPYGGTLSVLRAADAPTSYRRLNNYAPSMRAISAAQVFERLRDSLAHS